MEAWGERCKKHYDEQLEGVLALYLLAYKNDKGGTNGLPRHLQQMGWPNIWYDNTYIHVERDGRVSLYLSHSVAKHTIKVFLIRTYSPCGHASSLAPPSWPPLFLSLSIVSFMAAGRFLVWEDGETWHFRARQLALLHEKGAHEEVTNRKTSLQK